MTTYVFMTGASQYRCKANSREEVLQIVRDSLDPTPEMMSVIESTLYEEQDAQLYQEERRRFKRSR